MDRDSSEIFSLDIDNNAKLEKLVQNMTEPGMVSSRFRNNFVKYIQAQGTPEQRATLLKLYNSGWFLSKLLMDGNSKKIVFSAYLNGAVVWVPFDGKTMKGAMGKVPDMFKNMIDLS